MLIHEMYDYNDDPIYQEIEWSRAAKSQHNFWEFDDFINTT